MQAVRKIFRKPDYLKNLSHHTSSRYVLINKKQPEVHCKNKISSSKCTVLNFLPKFLLAEFSKYSNLFFLFMVSIQQIENVSPTGRYATLVPLTSILIMSAFKEIVEEIKRRRSDKSTNLRQVLVLKNGTWVETVWQDVVVGDFVKVLEGEQFPADLLVISSSEPQSICYIETVNLDGETNMKIRQGLPLTSSVQSEDQLSACTGIIEYEKPNNNLYSFIGNIWFSKEKLKDLSSTHGGPRNSLFDLRFKKKDVYEKEITDFKNNKIESKPMGPESMLLRGASLKNTEWVIGVVIYTGKETKMRMGFQTSSFKRTFVVKQTNTYIAIILVIMLAFAVACTIAESIWLGFNSGIRTYIQLSDFNITEFFLRILTFIVIFESFIPISLHITLEFVKFCQAYFINWDKDMYHERSATFATAKTSNLNEELGQINFVFTDKTGTLTQNIMRFKRCTIAGKIYGRTNKDTGDFSDDGILDDIASIDSSKKDGRSPKLNQVLSTTNKSTTGKDDVSSGKGKIATFSDVDSIVSSKTFSSKRSSKDSERLQGSTDSKLLNNQETISEFVKLLAVCHTVVPQVNAVTKEIHYMATSPDEEALVKGASLLKHTFLRRTPTSVVVDVMGTREEYQILNVLEFSSKRKRMSVIVKGPDGKLKLYCKGADNVIYERLSLKSKYTVETLEHLHTFASFGFRTLCLATTYLDQDFYHKWKDKYDAAAASLTQRDEKLEDVAELIETDLMLLGATAVEDELQEGVPEAIETLLEAGIPVWVLTGDKQETAINIGYSCRLLCRTMDLVIMNDSSLNATKESLAKNKEEFGDRLGQVNLVGLVIDGETLHFAMAEPCQQDFLELALSCKVVLCCRVSPLQKSEIVIMVKKNNKKAITLAIGDGANDVQMIKAAHIGIGISGEEGLQAASASDYSIAQFRFLIKLLLVHGTYCNLRVCHLIKYTFYKNICLYFTNFLYQFSSGFSGQILYDAWTLNLFNLCFTAFPPLAMGLLDRHCDTSILLQQPNVYSHSQDGKFFTPDQFWIWILASVFHSIAIYAQTLCLFGLDTMSSSGKQGGYFGLGMCIVTYVITAVNCKSVVETISWTFIALMAAFLSVVAWFLFFIFAANVPIVPSLFGVANVLLSQILFWIGLFTIPFFPLLMDVVVKAFKRTAFKTYLQAVQEATLGGKPILSLPPGHVDGRMTRSASTSMVARMHRGGSCTSTSGENYTGFAFSQEEHGEINQSDMLKNYYKMSRFKTFSDIFAPQTASVKSD